MLYNYTCKLSPFEAGPFVIVFGEGPIGAAVVGLTTADVYKGIIDLHERKWLMINKGWLKDETMTAFFKMV